MSYEQKILLGLEDVRSICFQCKKCEAKVSLSPDSGLSPPPRCLQCQAEWIKDAPHASYLGQLMPEQQPELIKFLKTLAYMRKTDSSSNFGFRILLEFDAPKP
ncbi:MAG TPA: hypothetical protein VKV39_19680 [Candidatus Sulfotelmatobacter sp.]|nr:hypothetical protein [Candidatus Sulfotelmatobacter sp.]